MLNTTTIRQRAAEWVAYDDPFQLSIADEDASDDLLERYILASFYFGHVEHVFFNSEPQVTDGSQYAEWLTGSSVCNWHGVHCTLADGKLRITSFSASEFARNGLIRS